jgi:hypothetical protein
MLTKPSNTAGFFIYMTMSGKILVNLVVVLCKGVRPAGIRQ